MMGPSAFTAARSLRRDQSVKSAKVAKGTTRRILTLRAPLPAAARRLPRARRRRRRRRRRQPAALPRDHRQRHPRRATRRSSSGSRSSSPCLALVDAALSLVQRYIAPRVGEGLIFDMRTQVFDHVQRMPLAFFTRTQTGALVSRLNNDVIGAQEAFTDVLSTVVGNLISVAIVLVIMFFLSLADHAGLAGAAARVPAAGALAGAQAAGHHARALRAERRHEHRP